MMKVALGAFESASVITTRAPVERRKAQGIAERSRVLRAFDRIFTSNLSVCKNTNKKVYTIYVRMPRSAHTACAFVAERCGGKTI